MNKELINALEDLEKEKGIKKEYIFDALEAALISAYKRNFMSAQNVEVNMDRETGAVKVCAMKTVVEEVEDANRQTQISLEDAKKINKSYELGDVVGIEVTPANFGRIAAMTAKQVVMQRIREAERGMIYSEYTERENELVTGVVQRTEKNGNVFVDIGKIEAVMPPSEQISGEKYEFKERYKFYVSEVKNTVKGPIVNVSRSHPNLVKKMFEMEVPEIKDGIVEIKSVSREAGSRSKIAVYSKDSDVDPQGACIGAKGMRVQNISDELKGEKIDIVKWSDNPAEFIAASLSPSKVLEVEINEDDKTAHVKVPESQLSLAIGKSGQNVRLAARLTGWKIDIKPVASEKSLEELLNESF